MLIHKGHLICPLHFSNIVSIVYKQITVYHLFTCVPINHHNKTIHHIHNQLRPLSPALVFYSSQVLEFLVLYTVPSFIIGFDSRQLCAYNSIKKNHQKKQMITIKCMFHVQRRKFSFLIFKFNFPYTCSCFYHNNIYTPYYICNINLYTNKNECF